MPLPSYIPRSDSFGNWYFGGFQMDSQVEVGYGAATAITATQSQWNTFLNSALGSSNWVNNANDYYYRFANSYEPLTGTISTTQNYRFVHTSPSTIAYLNTSLTSTPVLLGVSTFLNPQTLWTTGFCGYAVANQYGMWVMYGQNSTPGTLTTNTNAIYFGWVKNPVFPTNTPDRVRNLVVGSGQGVGSRFFIGTRAPNVNTLQSIFYSNNTISCQTPTPGANTTDISILDPNVSNLNIGSLYNAVYYPGTGLTVGRLYKIPASQDPDGNTEQNIWLCAGALRISTGVDAGFKLIRVWSNNIT